MTTVCPVWGAQRCGKGEPGTSQSKGVFYKVETGFKRRGLCPAGGAGTPELSLREAEGASRRKNFPRRGNAGAGRRFLQMLCAVPPSGAEVPRCFLLLEEMGNGAPPWDGRCPRYEPLLAGGGGNAAPPEKRAAAGETPHRSGGGRHHAAKKTRRRRELLAAGRARVRCKQRRSGHGKPFAGGAQGAGSDAAGSGGAASASWRAAMRRASAASFARRAAGSSSSAASPKLSSQPSG